MEQKDQEVIYISLNDIPEVLTRKQFIRYFLRGQSYVSYTNKDCTIVQCKSTANRSITDLHKIVMSRFINTNFENVVRIVRDFIDEDNSVILVWCTQIEKVVLKYVTNKSSKWATEYSIANHFHKTGLDGYSLADYEKLMNNLE